MLQKHIIKEDELVRITRTHYESGFTMLPHTHEFPAISLILNGGFKESIDGIQNEVCRSKTLIKPHDLLHSDHYDSECTIICVYLKDQSALNEKNISVLSEWGGFYGVNWGLLQPYFKAESLSQKKDVLNSFLAQLSKSRSATHEIPDWIYQLRNHLDRHFFEVIQTSELAEKYGVHPVYLARAFRKYFGLSIKEYLKNLRIRNSMAAIISNNQSLTQIAFENGFADQSHFIRNFKQEAGTTPHTFRQLVS